MADSPYDYVFECPALAGAVAGKQVTVTHWRGVEAVSQPYRYEITIAVQQADIALEKLLNQTGTFSMRQPDGTRMQRAGIVTRAAQQGCDEVYYFYRLELEPRLVRLRGKYWSDVYLDITLGDLIRTLLGLIQLDQSRIKCDSAAAIRRPFVCQFEENCLDFLMRQLEHFGVYFWFEQSEAGETIVFADGETQQPQESDQVIYYPKGVIDPDVTEIAVLRLDHGVGLHPGTVTLHASPDYANTMVDLTASADVALDETALGAIDSYADNFTAVDRSGDAGGRQLATWRAQLALCASLRIDGESRTPGIGAGRFLKVSQYQRAGKSQDCYVVSITHEGVQALETSDRPDDLPYRGHFIALPRELPAGGDGVAPLQYRPPLVTPIPRIGRLINGFVDSGKGEEDKRYAPIDEEGRYKVRFCFERMRYANTRNSAWVRMASSYAGSATTTEMSPAGMHFPLREGTEVLIAFLNGDPDRPVIVAALPNSSAPSVVNEENADEHVTLTPAGNRIVLRDKTVVQDDPKTASGDTASAAAINLSSPNAASAINIGKSNRGDTPDGYYFRTDAHADMYAGDSFQIVVPGHFRMRAGSGTTAMASWASSVVAGLPPGVSIGSTGGLVIQNFSGANISAVEGITSATFVGNRNMQALAVTTDLQVGLGLKYNLAGMKDYSPLSHTEVHNKNTYTFVKETTVGVDKKTTVVTKTEDLGDSSTTVRAAYTVKATDITLEGTPAGAGVPPLATLTLGGGMAMLTAEAVVTVQSDAMMQASGETVVVKTLDNSCSIVSTGGETTITAVGSINLNCADVAVTAIGGMTVNGALVRLG